MISINVSAEEKAQGKLSAANIALALEGLERDGMMVLENVVSQNSIDVLRDKMTEDVYKIIALGDKAFNWNPGNVQQEPPPFPPYLFKDVLMNDFAVDVTAAALGKGVQNSFYSGNTAVKCDKRQPVHVDLGHLFKNMSFATPPFSIVVNVPLVDMTVENGATEIWLGTHKDTSAVVGEDIKITDEMLDHWRPISKPYQPEVKAGSIIIRDMRLWHAGTPNTTDIPRPMIAMIHYCRWWKTGKIKFPKGTEEFFKHPVLTTCADFVEGEIDYISSPYAANL